MFRVISVAFTMLLLTVSLSLYAQPFERSMGGLINERANCVEHTTDNGYIIAGTEKEVLDV